MTPDASFLAPAEHGGLLAKVLDRVEEATKTGGDVDEAYVKVGVMRCETCTFG